MAATVEVAKTKEVDSSVSMHVKTPPVNKNSEKTVPEDQTANDVVVNGNLDEEMEHQPVRERTPLKIDLDNAVLAAAAAAEAEAEAANPSTPEEKPDSVATTPKAKHKNPGRYPGSAELLTEYDDINAVTSVDKQPSADDTGDSETLDKKSKRQRKRKSDPDFVGDSKVEKTVNGEVVAICKKSPSRSDGDVPSKAKKKKLATDKDKEGVERPREGNRKEKGGKSPGREMSSDIIRTSKHEVKQIVSKKPTIKKKTVAKCAEKKGTGAKMEQSPTSENGSNKELGCKQNADTNTESAIIKHKKSVIEKTENAISMDTECAIVTAEYQITPQPDATVESNVHGKDGKKDSDKKEKVKRKYVKKKNPEGKGKGKNAGIEVQADGPIEKSTNVSPEDPYGKVFIGKGFH